MLNLLYFFIVIFILAAAMMLLQKWVRNGSALPLKNSKYLQMVDSGLNLPMGQKVSIVKTSEEYFLISHGPNGTNLERLNKKPEVLKKEWEETFNA